jgi:hypothetical protein
MPVFASSMVGVISFSIRAGEAGTRGALTLFPERQDKIDLVPANLWFEANRSAVDFHDVFHEVQAVARPAFPRATRPKAFIENFRGHLRAQRHAGCKKGKPNTGFVFAEKVLEYLTVDGKEFNLVCVLVYHFMRIL